MTKAPQAIASKRRARRGDVALVRLRSGVWGIRWGRRLARDLGVAAIESTEVVDEREARQILERRRIEVYGTLSGGRPPATTPEVVTLTKLTDASLHPHAATWLAGSCRQRDGVNDRC